MKEWIWEYVIRRFFKEELDEVYDHGWHDGFDFVKDTRT